MPEAFKDIFFQPPFYDDLSAALGELYPPFDREAFLAGIFTPGWQDRPLKERMRHTTRTLRPLLPESYREALAIMRAALPRVAHYGFEKTVWPDFVELYGLDDWDASLPAFEEFTQQMSAEFAVRPFIVADPARMMAQMLAWAHHPHEQVRRLASEGCRPRLPWGMSLPMFKADPTPILPILDALKDDSSETVRRSVANNLNDIGKDNPQVVIEVVRRWQQGASVEVRWIIGHALRSLVKQGHPEALDLLGFGTGAEVEVHGLTIAPARIPLGESITFAFDVISTGSAPQDLMIDYVLHLARANGKTGEKVFKLAKRTLQPGETLHLVRRQSFAPQSSRTYYAGPHAITIQINGTRLARAEFEVTGG